MNLIKLVILRAIEACGYILLKRSEYDRMAGGGAAMPVSPVPRRVPERGGASKAVGAAGGAFDFQKIVAGVDGAERDKANAIYSAVHELHKEGVAGDIVECGENNLRGLAIAAAALDELKDKSRHLTLFDVTENPHHRAEPRLKLWGKQRYPLADSPLARAQDDEEDDEDSTEKVVLSNSPIDIRRLPYKTFQPRGLIALLLVTTDNYPTNQIAVRKLLATVPQGGMLAVQGPSAGPGRRDAVADALSECGRAARFETVSATFRLCRLTN